MKGNMKKVFDIKDRTFQYALKAIEIYNKLQSQKNSAGWIIGKQYLRSATSIGANIQEAQSGESKADFIHKYSIAQKEARESLYWLRLLKTSKILHNKDLEYLIKETNEVISVITKIIVNTKKGFKNDKKQ
ncbi:MULTISPECIES: four helix bundle protein [unclassified Lebetimonas]|uniref:four helix bundle protein n=1 Tax=unclassified Lebetimonas TaxID=2648158 RepID=UPI0004B95142|nr:MULTISPECIES: four helix bundle protein [unclassified Lebetimonas]